MKMGLPGRLSRRSKVSMGLFQMPVMRMGLAADEDEGLTRPEANSGKNECGFLQKAKGEDRTPWEDEQEAKSKNKTSPDAGDEDRTPPVSSKGGTGLGYSIQWTMTN